MKNTVVVLSVLILLILFPLSAKAEEINTDEIYRQQYEISGADELYDNLPDTVAEKMKDFDISGISTDWLGELTPKNIFKSTLDFLKTGCKRPLLSCVTMIAVLLLSTVIGGLECNDKTVVFVTTVGVMLAAVLPSVSVVKTAMTAVSSLGAFMLAFVPVFVGVLISQGKSLTAAGFSTVMLAVSESLSVLCSFIIMPLTGMQLGLAISGSILSEINISTIGKTVKKISMWVLSLSSTVLLGVLSIQSLIGAQADNISVRTTKFIVGTAVPIVGNTVSEALSTVVGCLKMLSSSIAVYGIIAVALMFLPTILELLLWRLALGVSSMIAEMLSRSKSAELIRSVDSAVSFVLGVLILIGVLFIISVTVVSIV